MEPVELAVVMPVYNEEASILEVVREWLPVLANAGISHRLIAINDGSRDGTLSLLEQCAAEFPGRMQVVDQPNTGHGRSCRHGYERALREGAPWIFQIDSDGQCHPDYFAEFWRNRLRADCVFGDRVVRDDGLIRKLISVACRVLTALATGRDLRDANVPYRLMKREALQSALRDVPADFNLQNIALTLALKRRRDLKWVHLPIRFRVRSGGINSVNVPNIVTMGLSLLAQLHRVGKKT